MKRTLQKTSWSPLEPATEETATENLISESRNEKPLEQFLIDIINRTEDPDVIQAMANYCLIELVMLLCHLLYHSDTINTCSRCVMQ